MGLVACRPDWVYQKGWLSFLMQEIYLFYKHKEHLTDVESHIYRDILENKTKINQNLLAWMSFPVSHGQ